MELLGLFFAAPVTLVTSVIYTALAIAAFGRWPAVKKAALPISYGVAALVALEVMLLVSVGAKSAFLHLHHAYTVLHFLVFLFAPPAIANLVLHLTAKKEKKNWMQFAAAAACCWITCMSVVLGNIMVDEAIMGVDAGKPFYLAKKEPNQSPEPTAGLRPAVAHL